MTPHIRKMLLPLILSGVSACLPPTTPVAAGPTSPAITAADLRFRLEAFAHDSMLGRRIGTEGMIKATNHLAREAARIGLLPAGDSGGFFQSIHQESTARVNSRGWIPGADRNVIAILRGSDPVLRNTYVAIGAHSDAYGVGEAVEHDSLRAFNAAAERIFVARTGLMPSQPGRGLTTEERNSIAVNVDSLRRIRPPRRDSIRNGADDDGSGSVAMLEIAQAMASNPPRRSLLFVWHTGEEAGLLGSRYFTDNPTVPRDSIVAQLNIDMIGRGEARDIVGGSAVYLQLMGARRLSTELGNIVDAANAALPRPFVIDRSWDTDGHRERMYCRSDHASYARYGIPVAFFTTGLHRDYHTQTDEAEYIDYDHHARVTRFVHDAARRIASLDHRPLVDKPKPDPAARCVQ